MLRVEIREEVLQRRLRFRKSNADSLLDVEQWSSSLPLQVCWGYRGSLLIQSTCSLNQWPCPFESDWRGSVGFITSRPLACFDVIACWQFEVAWLRNQHLEVWGHGSQGVRIEVLPQAMEYLGVWDRRFGASWVVVWAEHCGAEVDVPPLTCTCEFWMFTERIVDCQY